jgi:hypothetical protein
VQFVLFPGVDCSEEAVAGLAQLNELLEAEMNFITSGTYRNIIPESILRLEKKNDLKYIFMNQPTLEGRG